MLDNLNEIMTKNCNYKRFEDALCKYGIPYTPFESNLRKEVDNILNELLP